MSDSNTTQYAILGLLTIQPMSGYDLSKNVRQSLNHFWTESNGQIYPTLKSLVTKGLIVPVAAQPTGKRPRQKYTLTPGGRKRLKEWLAKPPQLQPPRNEILLKLFLGRSAPKGAVAQHLTSFKRRHAEVLSTFMKYQHAIQKEHARSPDLKYWMLCLEYGIRLKQAQIDWCNSALRELAPRPERNRPRQAIPRK